VNTENTKIQAVPALIAVGLCVAITLMAVTNVRGQGEPLRYAFLLLPVAAVVFWLFGKARAEGRHPVLLYVLFIVGVLSFGAALNWLLWNTVTALMQS
jgi:hypothetical protein